MLVFLSLILFSGNHLQFQKVMELEPIPESLDLYLQYTLHIELGPDETYYIPNYPSGHIFMWNSQGKYQGFFGTKGEGPGEFTFAASLGGPRGYVYCVEDRIYVYDGGNRTISEFDSQRNFIRRIIMNGLGGMINNCQIPVKNRFVFYDSYFCEDHACRRIDVYGESGNVVREIIHDADNTWARDENTGRIDLFIFEPTLAMDYSMRRKELVFAQTAEPTLQILNPRGDFLRKLDLPIPRQLVSQQDIDEFHEQDWMKGNKGIRAIFPKEKAYFDNILTLKEGYLLFNMSPLYRRAEGYLVDFNGKMVGRFELECGEGGGLYDPRDQLFSVVVDNAGDFHIRKLEITTDSTSP